MTFILEVILRKKGFLGIGKSSIKQEKHPKFFQILSSFINSLCIKQNINLNYFVFSHTHTRTQSLSNIPICHVEFILRIIPIFTKENYKNDMNFQKKWPKRILPAKVIFLQNLAKPEPNLKSNFMEFLR